MPEITFSRTQKTFFETNQYLYSSSNQTKRTMSAETSDVWEQFKENTKYVVFDGMDFIAKELLFACSPILAANETDDYGMMNGIRRGARKAKEASAAEDAPEQRQEVESTKRSSTSSSSIVDDNSTVQTKKSQRKEKDASKSQKIFRRKPFSFTGEEGRYEYLGYECLGANQTDRLTMNPSSSEPSSILDEDETPPVSRREKPSPETFSPRYKRQESSLGDELMIQQQAFKNANGAEESETKTLARKGTSRWELVKAKRRALELKSSRRVHDDKKMLLEVVGSRGETFLTETQKSMALKRFVELEEMKRALDLLSNTGRHTESADTERQESQEAREMAEVRVPGYDYHDLLGLENHRVVTTEDRKRKMRNDAEDQLRQMLYEQVQLEELTKLRETRSEEEQMKAIERSYMAMPRIAKAYAESYDRSEEETPDGSYAYSDLTAEMEQRNEYLVGQ
jgi:hypothetical protein